MGIPFDTYLVDEVTAVGDARFKRKSKAVFHDRIKAASAIMVSHSLPELKDFCDAALVLHKGQIRYFEDLEEALEHHKAHMA
jgi:capsular polysaccharide transport system ATP-binding protein